MENKNTTTYQGIGLPGFVFLVFLVLKLCKVISWSWWWVTAPLWGSLLLTIIICVIVFLCIRNSEIKKHRW